MAVFGGQTALFYVDFCEFGEDLFLGRGLRTVWAGIDLAAVQVGKEQWLVPSLSAQVLAWTDIFEYQQALL